MSAMTRQEYDGERLRMLMRGFGMSDDEARKHLEREYPKGTRAVIDELRFRGLDATEWRVTSHCAFQRELAPPIVGGSRAWGRQHVEDFAEALEARGDLMPSAIYRSELGISWTEEQEILARITAKRLEEDPDYVG
jgi:hypothetical protein